MQRVPADVTGFAALPNLNDRIGTTASSGGVTFGQKPTNTLASQLTSEQLERLRKLNDIFSQTRSMPVRQQVEQGPVLPENQLTAEEKEFYGENEEGLEEKAHPMRFPRKAKHTRVSQTIDEDEDYGSEEDEEMVYNEDWVES